MRRRTKRALALALGLGLTCSGAGFLWQGARDAHQEQRTVDRDLTMAAQSSAVLLAEHFERAVASDLQLASQPAFEAFYREPGDIGDKVRSNVAPLRDAQQGLLSIEEIFPGAVSEACFIDLSDGRELARIVNGEIAASDDLSMDESAAPFYDPAKQQPVGVPYQSSPYVSPDSGRWVIATATQVALGDRPRALVHFETSIESLRENALSVGSDVQLRVVDAETGKVVMDDEIEQQPGGRLGVPSDVTFSSLSKTDLNAGNQDVDGDRVAYAAMPNGQTLEVTNANNWIVAASAPIVATGLTASMTPLILALFALGIPLLIIAFVLYALAVRRKRAEQLRVAQERDELDERMSDLSAVIARAAAGDLDVTFDVDLGDERMTTLARAFDATLTHLRGLVDQAQDSGAHLAQAAAELRATATQQAASASEQSAAVTQTTSTVEELAATAAQIADTAADVASAADQTLALTEEGLSAVRDSVSAMNRINSSVKSIASSSGTLDEKVNEIGRILSLIDELSEQTNLLALNAAIEAARAGEHGRGFAVVAAEVRKLAERAQQSTAQIQGLVTEIKAHTQSTVRASSEGEREVAHGVEVAGSAVSALDRIAEMVDNTTTAVAEISVATQQQRSASDQVVVAMGQVANVARQFAAGSTQAAVSAGQIAELSAQFEYSTTLFEGSEVGHQYDTEPKTELS